jgi:uroporphyrinogen decarboxylase
VYNMNSNQRVRAVLEGKIPDRVPVCLINFICVCRDSGFSIKECLFDPAKFAQAHMDAHKKYGHDMIHLQNGVVGIAQSFGCRVEYYETVCPEVVERPYKSYRDFLETHDRFALGELLESLVETTRILSEKLGEDVYIRADSEIGPFGVAGTLFGLEKFLIDLLNPDKWSEIKEVLQICSEAIIELGKAQRDAGAHMTGIGDPFAGPDVISPKMYENLCFPYHKYVFDELKKAGIDCYLHCCGDSTPIIDSLVRTGAWALELDYKINARVCREATLGKCTLIGNIDPSGVMCRGTPQLVRDKSTGSN